MRIDELAERIAEREYENRAANHQDNIVLSLYHNHIPRLEDADVVLYNEHDRTVAPHLNFDHLIHVLEMMDERDLPWSGD